MKCLTMTAMTGMGHHIINPFFWFLLQVNPFRDRICKVFSSSGDGALTFEDFLDMMSVFSEAVSI